MQVSAENVRFEAFTEHLLHFFVCSRRDRKSQEALSLGDAINKKYAENIPSISPFDK